MTEKLNPQHHRWMTDAAAQAVVAALASPDTTTPSVRFVGGCVRNALIGEPVEDVDLATVHEPRKVIELIEAAGLKAVPTGLDHGTITAVAQGRPFEITTLRADVETHGRHATVAFTRDWQRDAERRDFTMNAIYADPDGTLFDPVNGAADARARRVRFIGDPDARIKEDYLRILRFFRFNARYGGDDIDPQGLDACARNRDGLTQLSGERIQAELVNLLETKNPQPCLILMREAGILALVLPEADPERIDILQEEEGPGNEGADPSACALRRLTVLLDANPDRIRSTARRLHVSNRVRDRMLAMVRARENLASDMSEAAAMRDIYHFGTEAFVDAVSLSASFRMLTRESANRLTNLALNSVRQRFPLEGKDVIEGGLSPGPAVGKILKGLEAWWVDHDFKPTRAELMDRMRAAIDDLENG